LGALYIPLVDTNLLESYLLQLLLTKKPKLDKKFKALSINLANGKADKITALDNLDSNVLDFTVESLKYLDERLLEIRARPLTSQDMAKVVLYLGSYLGEVMRRNSAESSSWYSHEEAAKTYSPLKLSKPSIATLGVLSNGKSYFFPFAVICEALDEKIGKSAYEYANSLIQFLK